jgi:hypothetical protein
MINIPNEIWYCIFKYLDVKCCSNLSKTSRAFYNNFGKNKWMYIDLMDEPGLFTPYTLETYKNYKYIVDFNTIILNKLNVSDEVLCYMCEIPELHMDLRTICVYQTLSDDIIRKLYNIIDWNVLLSYQQLPIDILYDIVKTKTINGSNWHKIWSKQKITYDFILENEAFIEWHALSSNKEAISFELVRQFHNKLIWQELTKHGIHESLIAQFIHKMDFFCWINVSQFTQLSESFIKQYIDKLDINMVLRCQNVSEEYLLFLKHTVFIFDNNDTEFYKLLSLHQKLSFNFILENKESLYLKMMIRNKKISRNDLFIIYE